MDSSVGVDLNGSSKIKESGSKVITDQIKVDVVTFILPDFFNFFKIIMLEIE